jgi:hypothetical protein
MLVPPLSPCSYHSSMHDDTGPCSHRTTPATAVPRGSGAGYISHQRHGLDAARPADAPAQPRRSGMAGQGTAEVLATAGSGSA